MEPDITRHLVSELQQLNSRVAHLEGITDVLKRAKDTVMKKIKGKSNEEIEQRDIINALAEVATDVVAHDHHHFMFKVRGKEGTLIWDSSNHTHPFEVRVGESIMHPSSLESLKQALKPGISAPPNLHEYTSAVLRQEVRSGRRRV